MSLRSSLYSGSKPYSHTQADNELFEKKNYSFSLFLFFIILHSFSQICVRPCTTGTHYTTHTHTHTLRHRYVYLYTQEFCVPTDLYIMLGDDIIDKFFNQPGDILVYVLRKIIKLQINEKKMTTLNGLEMTTLIKNIILNQKKCLWKRFDPI